MNNVVPTLEIPPFHSLPYGQKAGDARIHFWGDPDRFGEVPLQTPLGKVQVFCQVFYGEVTVPVPDFLKRSGYLRSHCPGSGELIGEVLVQHRYLSAEARGIL